ncbi:MAG: enoyl-[acyl-carrier-protein] reductase [Candidatus Westeberhardia cardiocondylae]|nr:enoyl-[acyl-carrier-protein] reductase [Candidatus Westeberhardia cardiocondylae]
MGILEKKKFLITGISNNHSIAYGIAKIMHKEGAELAFSYQNERLKSRVEKFAMNFNSNIVFPCNVQDDNAIYMLFSSLYKIWPKYDGFVHSIAYAPKKQLFDDYVNSITKKDFFITHDISSYSFIAMAKACRNMLSSTASLVTLTYLGSKCFIPNYNVMGPAKASLEANVRYMANSMGKQGVRVNAISAGPVYTLASSGVKGFKKMLSYCKTVVPLRRLVTIENIGNVASFLCSDFSSGITGEILHVDCGLNTVGMFI